MFATAPTKINEAVKALQRKLRLETSPLFVDVIPSQDCQLDECFTNVARQVRVAGGTIQYSWTVWECPRKYIEGEFHALWVTPDGKSLDITPHRDGEAQILFIPDHTRRYANKLVCTVRLALSTDKDVLRFIDHGNAFDKFRAEHTDSNGRPTFTPHEYSEFLNSRPRLRNLGRNTPCPCGSGTKYKHCCGSGGTP